LISKNGTVAPQGGIWVDEFGPSGRDGPHANRATFAYGPDAITCTPHESPFSQPHLPRM
jgi:hypothetical protein